MAGNNLDFSRYLDVDVESVERPPSLPTGHYFATITGWTTAERNFGPDRQNVPVLTLAFRIDSADEDVDESALPASGAGGKTASIDYELNDPDKRGQYQLRRIATDVLNLDVKGRQFSDILDEFKGEQVKIFGESVASKKEEGVFFFNVRRVLAVKS